MNAPRRLLPVLLLASALGCSQAPSAAPDLSRVVALARLEPADGLLVVGATPGDRVDRLDPEMDKFYSSAGQEMGRLASWVDRNNEWEIAKTQLAEAKRRKDLVRQQGEAQIAEAQERLDQLRKQQGPDLAAQQDLINTIKQRRDQAEQSLRELTTSGVTRQALEQQRSIVSTLDVELGQANARYQQTKSTYEMNTALAERGLQTAKVTLDRLLAEVPLESLEQAEKAAADRVRHSLILSPGPGRILKIYTRPGDTVGTQPVLRFGDPSRMVALAEVYETDVGRIRVGNKAAVEFQDVPPGGWPAGEVKMAGSVTQIGQLVSAGTILDLNPAASADRRVVSVRVELDAKGSAEAAKYVNRQVRVVIETGQP